MADANQKNTNSSKSSGLDKTSKPVKAPLCQHHNGDCEVDTPEDDLQNAGVPRGLYCETLEEQRLREEAKVCLYDECYRPPE